MTRSASDSLYDDDFFAWTQDQAAALRQIPREALGNRIDIAHVAEEIADLGKRDLREVTSFLGRLFDHLIKLSNLPNSQSALHWRSEARLFSSSASDAFSPSMRQAIEPAKIWRKSVRRAKADLADAGHDAFAAETCPFTLDELVADEFDVDDALARLAAPKA